VPLIARGVIIESLGLRILTGAEERVRDPVVAVGLAGLEGNSCRGAGGLHEPWMRPPPKIPLEAVETHYSASLVVRARKLGGAMAGAGADRCQDWTKVVSGLGPFHNGTEGGSICGRP
jgi:hypothetical protein